MKVDDELVMMVDYEELLKELCSEMGNSARKAVGLETADSMNELMCCATVVAGNIIGNMSVSRKHASEMILQFCDNVSEVATGVICKAEESRKS